MTAARTPGLQDAKAREKAVKNRIVSVEDEVGSGCLDMEEELRINRCEAEWGSNMERLYRLIV